MHARRFGCLDAQLSVFDDEAFARLDPHAFGGFEEEVWRRLAVLDLILGDDDLKEFAETDGLKRLGDRFPDTTGSDAYGMGGGYPLGKVDDGLIGRDTAKIVPVEGFLIGHHSLGIEGFIEVVIHSADGFQHADTSQGLGVIAR